MGKRLGDIELTTFRRTQRSRGRQALDDEFKREWTEVNSAARSALALSRRGTIDHRRASLLGQITAPVAALRESGAPTYYSYTGVGLQSWYVGDAHQPFRRLQRAAVAGVRAVISEMVRFEAESVAGLDPDRGVEFDADRSAERITRAAGVVAACDAAACSWSEPLAAPGPVAPETVGGYAAESSGLRALVDFSTFPQTRYHEEHVFLSTIHCAEFWIFALRVCMDEARERLDRGDHETARSVFEQGVRYAEGLYATFWVLRTMPPERFADFRDATGNASAVQSLNYQLLEAKLFGLDPRKADVFAKIPHLVPVVLLAKPGFEPLSSRLASLGDDPDGASVIEVARVLDRKLATWRGIHLGFALDYLPPAALGTGDTAGAAFLQNFLRRSLFKDTEVDGSIVDRFFGEDEKLAELLRAYPSVGMAPGGRTG